MNNKKSVLAWHFSHANDCLGYGDNRMIVAGETLTVNCDPVLCEQGLHASARLIDALSYATSGRLWRVRVGGAIVTGEDKIVGTERQALWSIDANDVLHRFARQCAIDVIHLGDAPPIVLDYLESGGKNIRDAAWAAARAAARDAAWAAARDAARDAAWGSARDAARDAAWAAAWDAARAAARAAQNTRLTRAVFDAHKAAS